MKQAGKLKIAMLVSQFHPAVGGAETQALALSKALIERGHDVTVLTMRLEGTNPCEEVRGVPVRRFSSPRGAFGPLGYVVGGFFQVALMRPSIVHAHLFGSAALLACVCGLLPGVKTVCKLGRDGADGDVGRNLRSIAGRLRLAVFKRGIDYFVAINSGIGDELLGIGVPEKRILSIPNGVDTETFRPASPAEKEALRRKNSIPFSPCALFLGRLIRRKRVELLISIWPEVLKKFPDAGLVVAGDGEMRGALEELAREKGVAHRALFMGTVPNPEDFLRCADVYALPSETEGISNALLQAMACALPVVVAKNSGADALVEDGKNGFLTDAGDTAEILKIIERLFGSESLRAETGGLAKKTIADGFSIGAVAEKYEAVYHDLPLGT